MNSFFYALATEYNECGCNLWADNCDIKKAGLSHNIDFGIYTKLWRFKEIEQFISTLMQNETVKNEDRW